MTTLTLHQSRPTVPAGVVECTNDPVFPFDHKGAFPEQIKAEPVTGVV
jgi:hypothetical protein